MPHHRSLAPPPQRGDGDPVIHRELGRHYDALYELLLDGRPPTQARPVLDVGSGDGLSLSAIVRGTALAGVALDMASPEAWFGPPDWSTLQADAQRLPFADRSFRSALMVDVFEWLRHPVASLSEIARVTAGPIVVVQTDWNGLWFQVDEAEVGQELVRAFSRGAPTNLRQQLRATATEAGLANATISTASIYAERLEVGGLAWDLLEAIRRYLVIEAGRVRARRFDDWRRKLQRAADEGQFTMLLQRVIGVLRPQDGP